MCKIPFGLSQVIPDYPGVAFNITSIASVKLIMSIFTCNYHFYSLILRKYLDEILLYLKLMYAIHFKSGGKR